MFLSIIIMKIIFEDEHDSEIFLDMCRIIAYVLEETEKFNS